MRLRFCQPLARAIEWERTPKDWARSTFWTMMFSETSSWMEEKFQT
ncbi:MAG: hypothetical protein IKC80_08690 [Kiritimatiellae bacterium]|nr:hypothetical protein [Kiritimatiellia bacterium]